MSALDVYATPTAELHAKEEPVQYGGIDRKTYIIAYLGTLFAGYGLAFLLVALRIESYPLMVTLLICGISSIVTLSVLRHHNMGMSGWNVLFLVVPFYTYYIQARLFCADTGYAETGNMSRNQRIATFFIILIFIGLQMLANVIGE